MGARGQRRNINLPAPYLRRVWLDAARVTEPDGYPFCLPLFAKGDFELIFERAITIIVGENGTGKSTLLEGIAALAGYDGARRRQGLPDGRSFKRDRGVGRRFVGCPACELAAEDHERLVLPRGELLLGRALPGRGCKGRPIGEAAARLPLAFAR